MVTGVTGQSGAPAAKPVTLAAKRGRVLATIQLQLMVVLLVLASVQTLKVATPKLVHLQVCLSFWGVS